MPIALDPKATFTYVLEDDRSLPEEQRTVFTLRGLTVAEEAKVADSMISSIPGQEELSFRSGTHQLTVLRHGLRGWSNFKNAEGIDIPFETARGNPRHVTDECLDRILPRHRQEIVSVVMERGAVTEEEGE
jgi:hypothetical protein|tara:strand:- start:499 stop:891 length:393 start_codon:yes stop_codon:yes gene_type:complete